MAFAVSTSCGLLGCFLVVRRMSLLGDALSHSILPGLVIAYALTGTKSTLAMTAGALAASLLTAFLIQYISENSSLHEDTATGIVLTTMFSIGVLLVNFYAQKVDLDQHCVLYGEISFIPFEPHLVLFGLDFGPIPLVRMLALLALIIAAIYFFYQPLLITSFDPLLAKTVGIPVTLIQYGLLTLVASTVVSAFESVGAILVVAMLIIPGATAYLLTDRLSKMLLITFILACLGSIFGLWLAIHQNANIASSITLSASTFFFLAVIFSPRHGWIANLRRQRTMIKEYQRSR